MALAPRLDLRQSQQLVMTPQLQQAIKLLQLSNLELATYVEEQLEQNPFLERGAEEGGPAAERDPDAGAETRGDADGAPPSAETPQTDSAGVLDTDYENIDPDAGRADREQTPGASSCDWSSVTPSKRNGFDEDYDFTANLTAEKTLHEHLNEQLALAAPEGQTRFIGGYLIDLIDESGYLRHDLAEIAERLGADLDTVLSALRIIQSFDPAGVGARDLKECLALQLAEENRLDPAMAAFLDNLELLAKRDLSALKAATGLDDEDLAEAVAEIRRLNPKPGGAFGAEDAQTLVPDVYIRSAPDGAWKVELNSDTLPRVLVNREYFEEIKPRTDEDKAFVAERISTANWLVKSLDQRARTILKVSSEIVRQQDGFFAYGVRHLRPLNLKTVADAISMHESTVSRVTANKYVSTPRGVFELKYFFTSAIASTEGGAAHSAEAVRHRIRELIEREDAAAVLSDDRLVEILRADGIDIARRTVAKYREALRIPSSVQRRRLKKHAI